jgi:hypothetical protein
VAASTTAPAQPGPALPEAADPTRGTIRMAPPAPAEQDPDPITAFEDDLTRADGSPAPDPDATDLEAEIATSGPVEDLTLEELEERGMTGTAAAVSADDAAAREQLLAAENEAAASGPAEPVADSGATAEPVADSGAAAEPVAGAGAAAVAGQDVGAPAPDNPLANNAAAADPPADRDADELTVRRALLAGDVINGEPRNTLSGTVTVPAGGELLIYFYIEFAESIGQPVTHRWMNGGEVEEESAMQIDSAAGARVYTARLIGADRVGEWRVEAFTADGRLLRGLDFTVVAAEEEAAAATLADEPPAAPDL